MVRRVDRPFWLNFLSWHCYHRFRRRKAKQRQTAWHFINLIRSMPRGALVIDGGANVGRVTHAFRREGFEVHAFEPDPYAQALFVDRFGDDPMVHLHKAAIGASAGQLTLHRSAKFATRPRKATVSSSLVHRDIHGDGDAVTVDVVDLVAFIRGLGRRVDLVKLDIEGAEVELIERMIDEGVDREVGAVYVETHERFSPELAARTARLRARIAAAGITNINLDWM